MKLIVAGSRSISDYEVVRLAIIESGFWERWGPSIEIVSGAARGVDKLGEQFALRNNLVLHKFPAEWEKYGKKAGYLRNIQMGEFSDALVAVWDGCSRGTKHMIEWSRANGLDVYVKQMPSATG